jgi:hypothetical protein
MATIVNSITFGVFVERIRKYLSNGWPDISDALTDNEVLTYVYDAIAAAIVKSAETKFNIDGIYPSQDGFITTYSFPSSTLNFDEDAQYYWLLLPHPPVNLPLGVSIKSPFIAGMGRKSFPLIAMHAYQKGYNFELPTPNYGGFYEVEAGVMNIYVDNINLLTKPWTIKVPMLSPRSKTGSDDDVINIPDDTLSLAFDMVTQKLTNRLNRPHTAANTGEPRFTEQP